MNKTSSKNLEDALVEQMLTAADLIDRADSDQADWPDQAEWAEQAKRAEQPENLKMRSYHLLTE